MPGDEAGPAPFAARCLTALVLAGAGAATLGVFLTLASPAWVDCGLAAAVAAALLLRARAQRALPQRIGLLVAGTAGTAATLVAARHLNPALAPWLCALAAASGGGGAVVRPPRRTAGMAPVARHVATLAECAVLAAIVPLTAAGFGLYDAVTAQGLP